VVRRILTRIMYPRHRRILHEAAFLPVINYPYGKKRLNITTADILSLCSAFVQLEPLITYFKKFGLINLSVKEFLKSRPEYAPEWGDAFIAQEYLEFMNYSSNIRFNLGALSDIQFLSFTFRYYTTEFWVKHCSEAGMLRRQGPLASLLRQLQSKQPLRKE
jgi:hypothetical protein